jgi:hypothetical protein
MKACTDLLYIFVMNWDNLTSATSVDTAISTSAVATSSSSQESVNCTNSLTLKQLIAAMSVNWHSKCVFLIHSDLKKREWNSDLDYNKLLLNWMWTCQTTMSVCSSDTYTVAWRVGFKSGHTLNCGLYQVKQSFKSYDHWEADQSASTCVQWLRIEEKSNSYLKSFKTERKPFANTWPPLNKHCWKQKAWNEMMLSRKHFLVTVLTQHSCELWLSSQSLCCMMSTLSCYSESVTT